jgi:peptidoglycan/LPS O-acetylase OafA/YrhL
MSPDSKSYFNNLDGLRFLLAFIVFGSHSMLGETINEQIGFDFLERLVRVFTSGHLSVSFFFVLSGFLITYLMLEEQETTGKFNVKNFYIRRIFRIWPLYYCVLIFSYFIYPFIKTKLGYVDQNPYSLIHQLLFLANFDNIRIHVNDLVGVAPMMIGINWSVSIEEQFYLGWPLLFKIAKARHFWIVCTFIIFSSLAFRMNTIPENLYYHTLSVISDMAIGGLCAWVCFFMKNFRGFIERVPRLALVVLYIVGLLLLMYSDRLFSAYFMGTGFRILTGAFFCFVIIEQCFAIKSWYKFEHFKIMSSWGKYTYALYMLHPIGIQSSIISFRILGIDRADNFLYGLLYVIVAFTVSILLSMLSFQYLEKFFLNKRKHFH